MRYLLRIQQYPLNSTYNIESKTGNIEWRTNECSLLLQAFYQVMQLSAKKIKSFASRSEWDRIFAGESLFGAAIWCGSRDVVHPVMYPGQEKEEGKTVASFS